MSDPGTPNESESTIDDKQFHNSSSYERLLDENPDGILSPLPVRRRETSNQDENFVKKTNDDRGQETEDQPMVEMVRRDSVPLGESKFHYFLICILLLFVNKLPVSERVIRLIMMITLMLTFMLAILVNIYAINSEDRNDPAFAYEIVDDVWFMVSGCITLTFLIDLRIPEWTMIKNHMISYVNCQVVVLCC